MNKQQKTHKRVLVISNNVLSTQNNNGKTLLSFFKDLPCDNLAQLFFSSEIPDHTLAGDYFRISDEEVVKSSFLFAGNKKAGEQVRNDRILNDVHQSAEALLRSRSIKRFDFVRLAREIVWKTARFDLDGLYKWVEEFSPDVIFFCAGDSVFAYDIYKKVCSAAPSARKVVYVTDDYILPRAKISPFWWLRRNLVFSRMKEAAIQADVFVTISNDMKKEYRNRLGVDSITIFNIPEDMRIIPFEKSPRKDLVLVYAGGLHFERWKTLRMLASSIRAFNDSTGRSVLLKVYSHQRLSPDIVGSLEVAGASEFCGSLNPEGVRRQLNDADILVHVESFDKGCIESTRLSISTKIAEYLSVQSTVLAIGPGNVASMRFLKGRGVCITSIDRLEEEVATFLSGELKVGCPSVLHGLEEDRSKFYSSVFE